MIVAAAADGAVVVIRAVAGCSILDLGATTTRHGAPSPFGAVAHAPGHDALRPIGGVAVAPAYSGPDAASDVIATTTDCVFDARYVLVPSAYGAEGAGGSIVLTPAHGGPLVAGEVVMSSSHNAETKAGRVGAAAAHRHDQGLAERVGVPG